MTVGGGATLMSMTNEEFAQTLESIEEVIDRAKDVQQRLDVPVEVRAMASQCFLTYALELTLEVLADLPQEKWAREEPQPALPIWPTWQQKAIKS